MGAAARMGTMWAEVSSNICTTLNTVLQAVHAKIGSQFQKLAAAWLTSNFEANAQNSMRLQQKINLFSHNYDSPASLKQS